MTAKNIIIATGSVPFVPPGIEIDGMSLIVTNSLRSISVLYHARNKIYLFEFLSIIFVAVFSLKIFVLSGGQLLPISVSCKLW